jgi:hypothetical protein
MAGKLPMPRRSTPFSNPNGPHQTRQGADTLEFGHKVFLAESARGLITQYDVLDGNPVDEQHVVASLQRHKHSFAMPVNCMGRIGLLQRAKRGVVSTRRRQGGVNPAAWWQQNARARSLREEFRVQGRSALWGGHRGSHLGVVPQSRYKGQSRQRPRALRPPCSLTIS